MTQVDTYNRNCGKLPAFFRANAPADRLVRRTKWASGRQPRILVVEGNAIVGLDIGLTVKELGYGLIGVATSVREALHLLDTLDEMPSCVLLDARLENEFSARLLDALREKSIHYVVVTGVPVDYVRTLGFHGPIVEKPFCTQKLGAAILSCVS